MFIVILSPDFIVTIAHKAPDKITSPAFKPTPNSPNLFASQATALTGLPSAAAPAPVCNNSPLHSKVIPQVVKSIFLGSAYCPPNTIYPQEALSATVS